jgi:hypothetical protein
MIPANDNHRDVQIADTMNRVSIAVSPLIVLALVALACWVR